MLQEMLEAEMDASIGYVKNEKIADTTDNKRNGYSTKTVKSQYGEFPIDIPRDRNGEFEPKIVQKYQRNISGIEEKIISLYARGMTTRAIHDQIQDIYGIDVSAEMVSKITDKILPEVKEWQLRPLNPLYPFVFMDAIHFKVRDDGRIVGLATLFWTKLLRTRNYFNYSSYPADFRVFNPLYFTGVRLSKEP